MPFSPEELDILREEVETTVFNARCRIYRHDAEAESIDNDSLKLDRGAEIEVYDGPCFVQATTRTYERTLEYAEEETMARTYHVRIRWSVADLRIGDIVEVYESEDPFLDDKTLTVLDPQAGSAVTLRQMIAELNLGLY